MILFASNILYCYNYEYFFTNHSFVFALQKRGNYTLIIIVKNNF